MKATFVRTLFVTVLSCCFAVQAARTPAQKLELVQSQLDATVKGADMVALTPAVSDILKVDAEAFTKLVVEQKVPLSQVATAQFLSIRTQKTVQEILQANPQPNWPQLLEAAKIPLEDVSEFLDECQSTIGFAMMDQVKVEPAKKKADKKRS